MAFLPLRELEPFAGSSSARFLPLHRARIARQEALLPELLAMAVIGEHQRAGDAELAASDRVPAQLRCDPAAHLASTAASGVGCCAACGCSGPAYTLSICFTCWRDKVVFGNIPHTAFSMTRSGNLLITLLTGVKRSCLM